MRQLSSTTSRGFTLIEMLVIAPIVILVIGSFIAGIVYLTGDALQESGKARLLNTLEVSLNDIEADVKTSGAFLSVNNMPLTTPQGANDLTQNFTNSMNGGNTLILNTFVTDRNPMTTGKGMVYLRNSPNTCTDPNLYQNQIMTMNTVYFIKGKTLWKRVLATNGYASKACPGVTPWQRPSCAPGKTGTNCFTQDEAVVSVSDEGVIDIKLEYYTTTSAGDTFLNAATGTDAARQTTLNSANTVRVSLRISDRIGGEMVEQRADLRVTRPGPPITYATPV